MLRSLCYDVLEFVTGHRGTQLFIGPDTHPESFVVPLRWRHWFGKNYEAPTFDFVATYCRVGMTFLDIGAHFGIFSISAARRLGPSGKIFSFEPCPSTRATMCEFLRLNPVATPIEVREEAVWNASGTHSMYISETLGDAANTMFRNQQHQIKSQIKTISLDDFVTSSRVQVDCLKIDAEGAELAILRGGRKLLMQQRPKTHLSLHPIQIEAGGGSLAEVWDLANDYGMRICLPQGDRASREWLCAQHELLDVLLLPA